jgi:hypothetical protein
MPGFDLWCTDPPANSVVVSPSHEVAGELPYELPSRRPSRWSSFQAIAGFALTIDRNTRGLAAGRA